MALKPVPIAYLSRINALGFPAVDLANVRAQAYVDGLPKAVGTDALTLSQVDKTNAPGLYAGVVTTAMLTAWGAAAGQTLTLHINSPTQTAPDILKFVLTAISTDDLDAHLTLQDAALASVKADTSAIKGDLETGPAALSVLSTKLDKILNNSGFALSVPDEVLRPGTGSNKYRIPVTFYDDQNEGLIDVDNQAVVVTLVNQAGDDRSSYLTGYTAGSGGGPGSAPAVRDSLGQYHVDLTIPSTAAQEQLQFTFAYAIRGQATARKAVSLIVTDVQAQGFALQSTLLDVQARATDIQSKVNDGTIGLAAANTLQQAIRTQTDKIGDPNIGLASLKAQSVQNGQALSDIEGLGFDTTQDSLRVISQFLRANLASGGRAV